jgi:hypothetical protein
MQILDLDCMAVQINGQNGFCMDGIEFLNERFAS